MDPLYIDRDRSLTCQFDPREFVPRARRNFGERNYSGRNSALEIHYGEYNYANSPQTENMNMSLWNIAIIIYKCAENASNVRHVDLISIHYQLQRDGAPIPPSLPPPRSPPPCLCLITISFMP